MQGLTRMPGGASAAEELTLHRAQSPFRAAEDVRKPDVPELLRAAPDMQVLRRQSREQAQTLARQAKNLEGLQEQLRRQEKLVQGVLEQTGPARDPGALHRLTDAVMREMEGRLRLERQRRGLV
jgi:hypothetical protein